MFHHQKSSKSSDQNLQINLLQPKQRESRVNFVRANHNQIRLNRLHRSSAHIPSSINIQQNHLSLQTVNNDNVDKYKYNEDDSPNPYEYEYDNENINKFQYTQSMLTNPNENNAIVGAILFVLLALFTPLQTITLTLSQQYLQIQKIRTMLLFLLISQCIAFAVLYYYKWVDSFSLFFKYLQYKPNSKPKPRQNQTNNGVNTSFILFITMHPYILTSLIILLTMCWQFLYSVSILWNYSQINEQKSVHLILFYIIILPDITISLYFQDQLHKNKPLKLCYMIVIVYLIAMGTILFEIGVVVVIASLIEMSLLYLSVRVGKITVLIQYITKILALNVIIIISIVSYFVNQQQQEYNIDTYDIYTKQNTSPVQIITFIVITSTSMLIVRCINSKILRQQLYKYFYSDYSINTAILITPAIICYVFNKNIQIFVSVIGCCCLALIGFWVKKKQDQSMKMDINQQLSRQSDVVDVKNKQHKNQDKYQKQYNPNIKIKSIGRVKTTDLNGYSRQMKQFQ